MTTSRGDASRRALERDGFVVRGASVADAPAMLRVIEAAFGDWPSVETDVSPLEFLQWKLTSPHVEAGQHLVVEHDGEIVVVKPRWVALALLDGAELMTDAGCDFAVLPAFQDRGLSRLVNDYEDAGLRPSGRLFLGLGSKAPEVEHMSLQHSALIGQVGLPLRIWARPLRARTQISTAFRSRGVAAALAATVAALTGRNSQRRSSEGADPVTEIDRFDERADALWAATRGCFDFSTIRDAAYLNWRYADRRAGRRTLLARHHGDELTAYAVLQPSGDALELSDWLVHPSHERAGIEVFRRAMEIGRQRGAATLVAWLPPGHRDEPAFEAAGFVPTSQTMEVRHKPPRGVQAPEELAQLARPGMREHVTLGDFDFG
jgi:hypothetical protein